MTNKEIKFELAKGALATYQHMTGEPLTKSLENLYNWIVKEPKTCIEEQRYNEGCQPITKSEIIGCFEHYLRQWCEENNYATLLITKGGKKIFEATLLDKDK